MVGRDIVSNRPRDVWYGKKPERRKGSLATMLDDNFQGESAMSGVHVTWNCSEQPGTQLRGRRSQAKSSVRPLPSRTCTGCNIS